MFPILHIGCLFDLITFNFEKILKQNKPTAGMFVIS